MAIDTANKFALRRIGARPAGKSPAPTTEHIHAGSAIHPRLTIDEALNLALWLVALADPTRQRFDEAWRLLNPDPTPRTGT
jgi:hypothetical protein